jgi:hypothetical protein
MPQCVRCVVKRKEVMSVQLLIDLALYILEICTIFNRLCQYGSIKDGALCCAYVLLMLLTEGCCQTDSNSFLQ